MLRFYLRLRRCLQPRGARMLRHVRGIYVYTNDVSQIGTGIANELTASFNLPGVDGVAVVIGWNAIEPALGQYQFALLDQWIAQVSALGKKIDLVIPAGSSTPPWLFQPTPGGAGAAELNFTVSPHGGSDRRVRYRQYCGSVGSRLSSPMGCPAGCGLVPSKKRGNVQRHYARAAHGNQPNTEELRLPAETAASTGLACVSNSIATWQQAGYRPSLLLQAWNTVQGSFTKSFPDKSFAVSIIPSDAFPGIAEDGSVITGHIGDENEPLLMSGGQLLGNRLVVQFDFLMPGERASTVVTNAAQNYGTLAAFQTNEYLGAQGAGCSEPVTSPTPCNAATYLTLLQTGIYPLGQDNPLRAQYIEVFHANATAFPADIQQAHLDLTCNYALSVSGEGFSSAGGSGTINIATGTGCPWSIGTPPPGVTIASDASGTGPVTVTFQVAANSGGDLSNSFTIAEQTFTVEQEGASIAGLNFIGSMAHLAAEENWTTAFTLVNKSAASATARLSFFGDATDPGGNGPLALPLAFPQQAGSPVPLLAASFDRTLAANASLIVDTRGCADSAGAGGLGATGGHRRGGRLRHFPPDCDHAGSGGADGNAQCEFLPAGLRQHQRPGAGRGGGERLGAERRHSGDHSRRHRRGDQRPRSQPFRWEATATHRSCCPIRPWDFRSRRIYAAPSNSIRPPAARSACWGSASRRPTMR